MNNINYFGLFKEIRYILISTILSIIGVGSIIFVYNHTGIYGAVFFAIIIFLVARLLILGARFTPPNHDHRPLGHNSDLKNSDKNGSQNNLSNNKANNQNINQNKTPNQQDKVANSNQNKNQETNSTPQNNQRNVNWGNNNSNLDI